MASEEIISLSALSLNDRTGSGVASSTSQSLIELREWNAANSPLLSKLPPEIRNQIYGLALTDDRRSGNIHLITRDLLRQRTTTLTGLRGSL